MNQPASDRASRQAPTIVGDEISITLCTAQVEDVLRQAIVPNSLGHGFALALDDPEHLRSALRELTTNNNYCRSVLRALIILAGFPADGSERELTSVAAEVGLSPGTTHRYLQTLAAAGLLARDAQSRRYRRPATRPRAKAS
jgi:IclR helix-turn-helix domain